MPQCPIHEKEMVCLTCRAIEIGKLGGQSRSKAKVEASRASILNTRNHKVKAGRAKKKAKPKS